MQHKSNILQINARFMRSIILSLVALLVACTHFSPQRDLPATEFQLEETTIVKVHAAIKQGKVNCHAIVQSYLQRIEKFDKSTGLNSIVLVNPKALIRADTLDKKWLLNGQMKSLHCIPVILKDNFHTADMVTTAGSVAMREFIPPTDAYMVRKLREADAIIIAKSNMAEWAFSPYYTISSSYGETRNAYDLQRVPAGSSGGTASAVAANFGLVGMGTDTGNSIRGPASHLALVGIRSTIGATSRSGIVPLLLNRDIAGPMARTVEDTARVFNVIAGYDADDTQTLPAKEHVKHDYTSYLDINGLRNVRIGVLREISNTPTLDLDIEMLFENALRDLQQLGATIVDPFEIPNFDLLTKATGFCSRFRHDINNYFTSLGDRAPVSSLREIVEKHQYLDISEGAMKWAMSESVPPQRQEVPCIDVEGDPRRKALLDAVMTAMDDAGIDVIIYPSWNNPARIAGDMESPHGNNSPIIAPHTGQPAITVPMGYTQDGLPAGLQMLGRPFAEADLFKFAYAYEQATQHRIPPQQFVEQNREK